MFLPRSSANSYSCSSRSVPRYPGSRFYGCQATRASPRYWQKPRKRRGYFESNSHLFEGGGRVGFGGGFGRGLQGGRDAAVGSRVRDAGGDESALGTARSRDGTLTRWGR